MKIIEIGNLFLPDYVPQAAYFSDYYFLDADVIFISANALKLELDQILADNDLSGRRHLKKEDFAEIQKKISERTAQLQQYTENGGNLFVQMESDWILKFTVEGDDGKVVEVPFDFFEFVLLNREDFAMQVMRGDNLIFPEADFESYFQAWDCSYEFSFTRYTGSAIAKVKNTHQVVSVAVPKGKGLVVLLPKLGISGEDYGEFEGSVYRAMLSTVILTNDLSERVRVPQELELPKWCEVLLIGDEKKELNGLDKLLDEKSQIEEAIAQQQAKLKQYKQLKQLLTESGKALEAMVEFVFLELGFNVLPSGHNRDDLIVESSGLVAVIEVKGVKGSAGEGHAAQLMKWVSTYHIENGSEPKGILIINGFRGKRLNERTERVFPDQMLPYCRRMGLCLMTTAQLLSLYLDFKGGSIGLADIESRLFDTIGEMDYGVSSLTGD